MVSLHGASVALPSVRRRNMQFTVHRHALDLQMQARMLGQLGIGPGFHVFGIAFTEHARISGV